MRHIVVIVTFLLLATAWVLSVAWFYLRPGVEAAIGNLVLLATITGLFIDRWLAEQQRRRALLRAMSHELYVNLNLLSGAPYAAGSGADDKPRVYTRLFTSSLQATLASGAFAEPRDSPLFRLMHDWLHRATEFNDRLTATEMSTFLNRSPENVVLFAQRMRSGAVMAETRRALHELSKHLVSRYDRESGIGSDTVLFAPQADAAATPHGPPATLGSFSRGVQPGAQTEAKG
jgi:uncharacterized protein YjiS (DUF1127 family)